MEKGQLLGQILELMKDVPFFKDFTQEEKYCLASSGCEAVRYLPHEEIIKEGEMEHVLYIILKGEVGVTKNVPSPDPKKPPKKAQVAKLSAGAVFGEITLICKRPRTSGVHAHGEVIALRVNGEMFDKMEPVFKNKIQARLIDLLVKRLDDMNAQITDIVRWQRV